MQIHDLPNGTIGATEYAPIDNGTTNRKTTLSAIGTYIINNVTESLGGVTRSLKAAIDAAWTKLGSGSISNVGADVSAAIGNDVLGTTATSLSGAIAEHEGDISSLTGTVTALDSSTALSVTLTQNAYVNNIDTVRAYKVGKICICKLNFNIGNAFPSGGTYDNTEIGSISGWTSTTQTIITIPPQNGTTSSGIIMAAINTTGKILLSNRSGTACSGFYRGIIVTPMA